MRPQAAVDWWLMKPLHFFVKRDVSSWFTRFITPPPARTKYKNVLLLKIFLFGLVLDHMSLMFDCKPYFAVKCLVSRFSSNGGLVAAGALVREWMGGGLPKGWSDGGSVAGQLTSAGREQQLYSFVLFWQWGLCAQYLCHTGVIWWPLPKVLFWFLVFGGTQPILNSNKIQRCL